MTRDETRAKGAQAGKMTNFEKYFGTPAQVAINCVTYDAEIGIAVLKLPRYPAIYFRTRAEARRYAVDWLNQEAED